jgi:hypothetical protein
VVCALVKSKILLAVGLAVLVGVAVLVVKLRGSDDASPSQSGSGSSGSAVATADPPRDPGGPVRIEDDLPMRTEESYPLDLEKLRGQIPENLYWKLDAPTKDVAVAKERAARAKQRNTMLGRIQANEASEEEIRAYYAERRKVSTDYLELAKLVLAGKAGEVSERDRGLFELSVKIGRAHV